MQWDLGQKLSDWYFSTKVFAAPSKAQQTIADRAKTQKLNIQQKLQHTLVNELVESMLSISSWFPPHNRPSGILHFLARASHILPIALHVTLLEVGWEPMHILSEKTALNHHIVHSPDFRFQTRGGRGKDVWYRKGGKWVQQFHER